MKVPRPFEPEEVNQPQGREYKKEKPLATEDERQSEDYHGGDESTESLPDSPNEGSEEQEKQQSNDESSADNGQQSQSQQSQDSSEGQSQQSNSGESVNERSTDDTSEQPNSENKQGSSENQQQGSSGTESSESGDSQQSSGEQSENQSSSQTDDSEESNNEQEASDSDSQESNGEDGETSDSPSDLSEESDSSDGADDSDEQEEVSDSNEENEEQMKSGTYNTKQVFTYTSARNNSKLSRTLYEFIEYIADETKVFNNLSADYYEPKKLMLRRYQGKSLNATKSGKIRETIVVLLDNSGSMDWVHEYVLETARALIQRHDAEIYFTPNGYIETQLTRRGEEQVKHENVIDKIASQQLKVLYLGDYDGANTPIELSWKTKVFWLCPESRYRRFRSHDWVSYDESDFRGFFARTYDAKEMAQALKRFSGFAQFTRYWYDPHEREVFHDD